MPLQPGTRLGSYEIVAPLGAGGMGEVYRATDTNLKRAVAIKVLPDSLAADPDRLARFQREAELLAALNHPNIAHIHGLEKSGGAIALVMELVEGLTLDEMIGSRPMAQGSRDGPGLKAQGSGGLPVDEAIAIARQIADALAAAHAQGIVHRDLKPANIKIRPDGAVKVLDFGLAKAIEGAGGAGGPGGAGTSLSMSPTITSPAQMTGAGMILGTAAYMSPEQARGKPADQRSDIWAFGCVLFEMLAGHQLFGGGETVSDAVAAILTRDPDWTALPPDLPAPIRTLLRRCLQRDPERRLHHIADARLDLDDAMNVPAEIAASTARQNSPHGPSPAPTSGRVASQWTRTAPWALTLLALGLAAATSWMLWGRTGVRPPPASPIRRLELNLPAGVELYTTTGRTVALAPDGSRLAFIGVAGGGVRQVYLRPFDQFDASALRGTENATQCFFSPDGNSIGFLTAAGEMKAISLADTQVVTVMSDVNVEHGAAWTADGSFVFIRSGALWRVPRPGGTAAPLTTLGGTRSDTLHEWPTPLPQGTGVLFAAVSGDQSRIESVDFATGARRVVVDRGTYPHYTADGHLVFLRDGELLAAPFDPARQTVSGPAVQVMQNLPASSAVVPVMDVSESGVMVYAPTTALSRLLWVSRQGVEQPVNDVLRPYSNPRLAPDGNRVLVQTGDLWIQDLARSTFTRLTTKDAAAAGFPIWTPDGRRVIYRSPGGLRVQDADGSGRGQLLAGTNEFDYPGAVTPEGETLVMLRSSRETSYDIFALSLNGPATLQPIVTTVAYEGGARLSPDGHWLAYVSNESGQFEVYLRPFPGPERRWPVSTQGGTQIVWNPNGKEIFYRSGTKMMAVELSTKPDVVLSAPRVLFDQRYGFGSGVTIANYDVARDGQRFIMVKDESSAGRLNIVLNLLSEPARPPRP